MKDSSLGKLYEDGEVIIRQGELGNCMYVVQAGQLEVIREGPQGNTRLAILENGDMFGEMSIFEREVRSATVRAMGEARVLTIDKRTFVGRIQDDPSLVLNLVRMMSRRIRKLSSDLSDSKTGGITVGMAIAERRVDARRHNERRLGGDRRERGR
jgi:CRP-like cAMP-binding protein